MIYIYDDDNVAIKDKNSIIIIIIVNTIIFTIIK